jgi:hypothetical protein
MNQLQTQIKSRNPQLLQQFNQMKNGNPQEIIKQIIKPEQQAEFIKYAQGFGVSEEQLKNLGINRNV